MIKLGPIVILKARDYPFIERAHRLARAITDGQIRDILEGRRHVHRNPPKRKREDQE